MKISKQRKSWRNRTKQEMEGAAGGGLGACLCFLAVMFVLGCFSKVLSWEMKPEVTIREGEYQQVEEEQWIIGRIADGTLYEKEGQEALRFEAKTAQSANGGQELQPEVSVTVYTPEGELTDWQTKQEVEECLIRRTDSYGEVANVIPAAGVKQEEDGVTGVWFVEETESSVHPFLIQYRNMNILASAGGWSVLSYALPHMAVDTSKPFASGDSVRIRMDEILEQDGFVEVIPASGASFQVPFSGWMVERMLPEGMSVEMQEGKNGTEITKIRKEAAAGERYTDVMIRLQEDLRELGMTENVQIHSFLETGQWLSFPKEVRMLVLWGTLIAVLAVWWYRDITFYGKKLIKRCQDEYLSAVLNEEIIVILVRAIVYAAALFALLLMADQMRAFPADLLGRLLPPDRVLDWQYARETLGQWMAEQTRYCRMFPEGEGARYYTELTAAWKTTAVASVGMMAAGVVVSCLGKWLYKRRTKV